MHYFKSETSHDILAKKTQDAIRSLRALSLNEKQVLHAAVFRKSHEALMYRGKDR